MFLKPVPQALARDTQNPSKSTLDPLGTLHGYPRPPKAPQGTLGISKAHPKAIQSFQMDAKTMPPASKVTKETSNIMQPPVSRKGPAAGGEALKIYLMDGWVDGQMIEWMDR